MATLTLKNIQDAVRDGAAARCEIEQRSAMTMRFRAVTTSHH